jgi:hypothetical protein
VLLCVSTFVNGKKGTMEKNVAQKEQHKIIDFPFSSIKLLTFPSLTLAVAVFTVSPT